MTEDNLLEKDQRYLWHPCSQMKDYESFPPLEVVKARGSFIELKNGKKIIDAFSSWWCKSLGHHHPRLKQALNKQLKKFEHVALVNTTNTTIVSLSEKLANLMPGLNKVFYASDGSCAVEIAMKMSLHSRKITGEHHKQNFIALENAYHGETMGAMSVSDLGLYREPYQALLFPSHFLSPLPYVTGEQDPLWHNCHQAWELVEKQLQAISKNVTAIIVEPIVQGATGMKIYSQDFLRRLRAWTHQHGIHLIADEIMTGLGRTGKMLACQHANITPDFLCLSKGLTSGWLPLSAVVTRQSIYDLFYDDYASGNTFLHSHTYSGNVLAASVALEALKVIEEENILANIANIASRMKRNMQEIAINTKKLVNVRSIGALAAADLICHDPKRRMGYEIYQEAIKRGAFLRPIGNTIYWLPPLNIKMSSLTRLKEITEQSIMAVAG